MKKRIVTLIFSLAAVFLLFSIPVCASQQDDYAADILEDFYDAIPEESGVEADEELVLEKFGFEGILNGVLAGLTERKSEIAGFFFSVIGFCALSVVCENLPFYASGGQREMSAALFTVMSLSLYPKIYSIFVCVKESLEAVTTFFGAALPTMTAITAASGAVKSAGVQAMNMNIALGIIGSIASGVLLPFSLALLALALVSSFGDGMAAGVSRGIKGLFTFGLGVVTAASSAAIALQSVVASAADSASLRAARYAAGSLIPIVGSQVSGALSTLAGGLAYAKSTVGAVSIATISAITVAPLVLLLLYRMVFSLAVIFMEYVDNTRGARCFSAYRTAFDAVISAYVMSTLVCIIEVIVFIKGGVA